MEGNLTFKESDSLVDHLVGCKFCLHKTAELTQLRSVFEARETVETPTGQPAKVSEVLSNLLSRLFGGSEQAVFAHSEEEEKEDPSEDSAGQDDTQKL